MSDEAKAGITWKCRFDSMFYGGMAHDCGHDIGPNECAEYRARCNAEPYLCIPADEARALLKGVYAVSCRLQAISNTKEEYAKTLGDQARALLATLPEK